MLKKSLLTLAIVGAAIGLLAFSGGFMHNGNAWARGWGMGGGNWRGGGGCPMSYSGQPGGGDFRPGQSRNSGGYNIPSGGVSQAQAQAIVERHIAKINPEYKVAGVSDGGSFYRFEIKSAGQTVESLAVDKNSGYIRPLN